MNSDPTSVVARARQLAERVRSRLGSTARPGFFETSLPGVRLIWSLQNSFRTPIIYEPGIAIIVTGWKTAHIGDSRISYGADRLLIVNAPVAFECSTFASPENPLLGIYLRLNELSLHRFAKILNVSLAASPYPKPLPFGLTSNPIDPDTLDASRRLIDILCSPHDTDALGAAILDEITYRVLKSDEGSSLLTLARRTSYSARVAQALVQIHRSAASPPSVAQLATSVGMSVTNFHRAFKAATSQTPLQYTKAFRLGVAMQVLEAGYERIEDTARRVGYQSTAHFTRDFRRRYAVTPSEVRARGNASSEEAGRSSRPGQDW